MGSLIKMTGKGGSLKAVLYVDGKRQKILVASCIVGRRVKGGTSYRDAEDPAGEVLTAERTEFSNVRSEIYSDGSERFYPGP